MPYNGLGTFTRLYSWVTDRTNSVKILADRMDAEMDGFATGLSNTITRDGQSTISAHIPFNSKRITGLGDATASTDALNRQTGDGRYFQRAEAEQTVASASTIDVSATGLRWNVTGTTGIATITMGASTLKVLRFSDAVTLTHNATTLILPGGSNLTTAAGDVLWFMSDGSGNARLMQFQSGSVSGGGDMAAATYDAAAIQEQVVGLTATQTLSNKTVSGYTTTADLASTANAKGASLIGIEDSGGNFTGTNVEAVLAELAGGTSDKVVWVRFVGSTGAITSDVGVTSVTRHGTGDYTVTFDSAFGDANYVVSGSVAFTGAGGYMIVENATVSRTTTTLRFWTWGGGAVFDFPSVSVIVRGNA